MTLRDRVPHPPVKWVGGKTELLDEIIPRLPRSIGTYYEPFVGGGAVFFELSRLGRIRSACLSDTCTELMTTYQVIRDAPGRLMATLNTLAPYVTEEAHYYEVRDADPSKLHAIEVAARFLFLNKVGFNGLYRLNKAGKFNVPIGRRKGTPVLYDQDNITACHAALKHARLFVYDFRSMFEVCPPKRGDAVYFDPPYVPTSATASFTRYSANGFTMDDQNRLVALMSRLVAAGVHCVLSNSAVSRPLYAGRGFEIVDVRARRNINSKADKRGPVGEILVIGRPR